MIQTERLLLRNFVPGDQQKVFEGLSHPEVIPYYGVSYDSFEATAAQMDFFEDLVKDGTGQWFAICSANNNVFYGAGGINSIVREHNKGEVGFWLLPEYWGMGILKEAMPLIFDYAFNVLKLHRVEGIVESNNDNCKKAIAKVGMTYEGTMRDAEIKNGRYISLDIYAVINPNGS